jgi:PPM family protein phosphatase
VITPDQALTHPMRNFVECCLGGEPFLPEMTVSMREPLEANDILLVCSDGLWGGLDEGELGAAFPSARAPLREELQKLAEKSVAAVGAGSDNTTAAAVRWIGNA